MVERKLLEAWGDAHGLDVLALGYATPFVGPFRDRAARWWRPCRRSRAWRSGRPGAATCDPDAEDSLPFPTPCSTGCWWCTAGGERRPGRLLREVWRVLAPSGRAIITVASRNGLWANTEKHALRPRPALHRSQLAELLREAELEPSGWTRALYVPPVAWMARWAEGFEAVGSRLWPPFAGLLMMEASKQTFAVKPRAERARVRVARPVLSPAPGVAPSSKPVMRGRLAPPRRRS
jgi:SAM-dependent methyltransferase